MARYRVTAPYVPVRVPSADRQLGAYRITGTVDLHEGALVPEDADPGHVAHLMRQGLIEPVEEPS